MDIEEFKRLLAAATDMRTNRFHPFVWIVGEPDIAENVYIGAFSEVNARGAQVKIGANCDIASFVAINCADTHKRCIGLMEDTERKDITIGENVFIGSHSFIKGGAVIGHHSVIAAASVVGPGEIPPFSLVFGIQCKSGLDIIETSSPRKRFETEESVATMSAFTDSACPPDTKIEHFTKYVRRQTVARFLAQYEIFKLVLGVKGSVVECGVHHGAGLMAWAKLSSTLEPYNYRRTIIGFDTFTGFPAVHERDGTNASVRPGLFKEDYDTFSELKTCVAEYDANRFINHIPKVELVRGDALKTIPEYVQANQHLLVSLLYLDFDIYEPTVAALKHLVPRMPRGAVIAFDEINNANWPGETRALLESVDLTKFSIQCFPFEPNVSYIQL